MRSHMANRRKDREMLMGIIIGFIIGTIVGIMVGAFLHAAKGE